MSNDIHLRVFREKSELLLPNGSIEIFFEGVMDAAAKKRLRSISQQLASGYLERHIVACQDGTVVSNLELLTEEEIELLERLVTGVTSEIGRALLALTIMQLCVKAIEPQQSIRLHKGGSSSRDFSWRSGISMRSLDKKFITPTLRKFDLLKLNADGFMMTRSLAENYPYSLVYKANIRGAKQEWIKIVEALEGNSLQPEPALDFLLSKLINQAEDFRVLAFQTLTTLGKMLEIDAGRITKSFVLGIISIHIAKSDYAARLMEVAMHSLVQAMVEANVFGSAEIKPLSQMRSANKKHGNIGDVELLENGEIIEAWDSKYGKTYLRDEIEELSDKLILHPHVVVVGFVISGEVERLEELIPRLQDIEGMYGVRTEIITFNEWVSNQFDRASMEGFFETDLASDWLRAYTESIAQKRRDIAPIDEPCHEWLKELNSILSATLDTIAPQ